MPVGLAHGREERAGRPRGAGGPVGVLTGTREMRPCGRQARRTRSGPGDTGFLWRTPAYPFTLATFLHSLADKMIDSGDL